MNENTPESLEIPTLDDLFSSFPTEEEPAVVYEFNQEPFDDVEVEQAITPAEPILTEKMIEHINKPPYIEEMLEKIKAVDEYAWNRGKMGLDFGLESLNMAFNGFNTGLHLVAGGANTGRD